MTEMRRERREDIEKWLDGYNLPAASIDEIRALLSDSAWRERIERQIKILSETYVYIPWHELRAIVDTGRGEGGEGCHS